MKERTTLLVKRTSLPDFVQLPQPQGFRPPRLWILLFHKEGTPIKSIISTTGASTCCLEGIPSLLVLKTSFTVLIVFRFLPGYQLERDSTSWAITLINIPWDSSVMSSCPNFFPWAVLTPFPFDLPTFLHCHTCSHISRIYNPDDRDIRHPWNVGKFLTDYMVHHCKAWNEIIPVSCLIL